MKQIRYTIIVVCMSFVYQCVVAKPTLARKPVQSAVQKKPKSCADTAAVPYNKFINRLKISATDKQAIKKVWGSLFTGYLARKTATNKIAQDWQGLKKNAFINNPFCEYTPLQQDPGKIHNLDICLDRPNTEVAANIGHCQTNFDTAYASLATDYWGALEDLLNPASFNYTFKTHPGIKRNYATFHLYKAIQRLRSICSVSPANLEPKVTCTGDPRDMGIIVNLQNNTQWPFVVTQSSLNGQENKEVGFVTHGVNALNLHTAALQKDSGQQGVAAMTDYQFNFYQLDPMNNKPVSSTPLISVGMYTGSQIVQLLQSLPHKQENIFQMNGRPTSAQHIANPDDWYMLLTQSLTPAGSQHPNPDQRIQAINISKLDGPYLLNMQINEQTVEYANPVSGQTEQLHIFQPSFVTAQVIQKPAEGQDALPLPILPQFLWDIKPLQMYWMMLATSYIAAATDFRFFGVDTFGSAFEYFKNLGYFQTKHEYVYFIDRYNLLSIGEVLHDVEWLMSCALYETDLKVCSDIFQLYPTQNNFGNFVANAKDGFHLNFQIAFPPKDIGDPDINLFRRNGFNAVYSMPYHTLYTLIESIEVDELESMVFVYLEPLSDNLYEMVVKDKKENVLNIHHIYLNYNISDIKISSIDKYSNWRKSDVDINSLVPFSSKGTSFALKYIEKDGKKVLKSSEISPIDKMDTIHTIHLLKYPLTEVYYDLYNKFKVQPYTRCYCFKDGILPKFLEVLTEQDWRLGIYMVPFVKNNKNLSWKNTGELTVAFYRYDKTLLGSIVTKGVVLGENKKGIVEPVKAYNLHSLEFNSLFNIYLDVGMKLQYTSIEKRDRAF